MIAVLKKYLYTAMRWIGTFIVTTGIILFQIFLSIGSFFVKEDVYSEIDWRWLVICIVLTIAELFVAYNLVKAKVYVISFSKAIFCLYAAMNVAISPIIIKAVIMYFSTYGITASNNIAEGIISIAFVLIEVLIVPILLAIFAYKAERNYKIRKALSRKE